MKKLTPHHTLTPKGGRVASRRIVRPVKKITSRCEAAPVTPAVTPAWMRRTRPKGSGLGLGA
jgi:hypothetical protein